MYIYMIHVFLNFKKPFGGGGGGGTGGGADYFSSQMRILN